MALDEKTATEVVGHQDVLGTSMTKNLSSEAAATGQGVSGYEDLSLWATVKKFKFNSFMCFIVALSAATDGYQIGMVGNIIANAGFVEQFGTEINSQGQKYLASPVLSGFNGIGSAGQIIGMVTLPFLSGRWGRKFAMYWLWFLLALSVALECIAKNWQVWLVAKLFGGIGVGCLQSTIPTYISEVAPTRIRGSLLMCYSLWWLIGQFFAPVALQVRSERAPNDYLIPIYTQWSQIGLMIIIYLFVPESPAWCVSQGKEERARKALRQLHWDVNGYDLDHQYNLLVLIVEHEKEVAAEQHCEKWYSIFRGQDGLRTVIAMWTLLSQQFIGLGIFFAYVTYFFQQTGIQDPFKITCIVSGINIFFSIIVIYLADVVGRLLLACGGTTICWVCTVVVGILGVTPETNASQCWFGRERCHGLGFIGEISSQRLRHYTAGFAAASTCVVGVVLGVLIPYMINANDWSWGLKTSWFFVGLGLPFTAAMWFLIPETKGRSAAELDELFERKIRPWRFHKTATVTQRMVETSKEANQMVV